jgi:uncharacterized phiE125 gp8 family phage protein
MGRPVIYTQPTEEPLSLEEAKEHLNVRSSTQDAYIQSLIVTARKRLERYLQRALITQVWDLYLPCFHECIELPYPPLVSVGSVTYKDLDGDTQTLTLSDYYHTVTSDVPGKLVRKYGVTFPTTQYQNPDAVVIRYTVGYGDASAVPEDIKHAMKIMLTDYFENRGSMVIGNISHKIPGHITDLVHSYKVYQF